MKKILILTLVLSIFFTMTSFGAMFPDIKGHWAEGYIDALAMEGVINGMPDGTFEPESYVTREQFLKMLLIVTADNANERVTFENPPKYNKIVEIPAFSDVSVDRWSYHYVKEAEGRVILKEEYGNTFGPVVDITREEAAVWMARALDLREGTSDFADNDKIGKLGLVGAAAENGLINGFAEDNTFRPGEKLTRAQAATMLQRAGKFKNSAKLNEMDEVAKSFSDDLNKDGQKDEVGIYVTDENYVIAVNDLAVIGGLCDTEESRYYKVDVDKNDNYKEIAVVESFYGLGSLAIYRYTGDSLYLLGYIESVGDMALKTDSTPIGDEWGAVSINGDGTVTANIGEQYVHTMLLRKQYKINDRNRLVPATEEFYTIGNYSEFTVVNTLISPKEDGAHPAIALEEGYVGRIVKTDLKNWIYIETGSGEAGWIYVFDDYLIDGEPLSYYLEGLNYAG